MATLTADGDHLVVLLSALENIAALRVNISVPLASVRVVRVSNTPWSELRGIRAPGTGLPAVLSLGTRRESVRLRRGLRAAPRARHRDDRRVLRTALSSSAPMQPRAARSADITRASGLAHAPR
jgi:hypothetical protein